MGQSMAPTTIGEVIFECPCSRSDTGIALCSVKYPETQPPIIGLAIDFRLSTDRSGCPSTSP
jgi:hypothetical protein